MMPLPSRPSNQKSGVCPWKAETFSRDKEAAAPSLRRRPPAMQAATAQHSIQMRMKRISAAGLPLIMGAALTLFPGAYSLFAQQPTENPAEHQREELGINPYTAPSVAEIFQQLDDLKPLPFEQLKRDFPQATHVSREQMGLVFGGLVADGFLIVEAQRKISWKTSAGSCSARRAVSGWAIASCVTARA